MGTSEFHCPLLADDAPEVLIYTDGGCRPNPGPGGWGAILCFPGHELELAGGHPDTTNNRMEITAALRALEALKKPCRVTVVTDSEYVHNTMTGWITGWSQKGWKRGKGPLLNVDLWIALARAALRHETYWSWTRGHAGHSHNDRCDELATRACGGEGVDAEGVSFHRRHQTKKPPPPPVGRKATAPIWLED